MKDLPRNEIVFVLNNLPDLQTLVAGVPAGVETHVLDASGDALAQMAALLDGRSGIEALHLLCHGSSGALHMGSATLEHANLPRYATLVNTLSKAMAEDGQWLLYGCNVAQGADGRRFVQALRLATGLNVAAASHKVGAQELGGSWELDYGMTGQQKALALPQWHGALMADAVIDLGIYGKLIAPVQVEGKWYYYWDRSGDGTSANTGSLNSGMDYTTHNVLDGLFNQDINGATNATVTNSDGLYGTTDTYRYATLNGVKLALPTANGGIAYPQGIPAYQNGTPATTGTNNYTFDELLAIWDAHNGTVTSTQLSGTPSAWHLDVVPAYAYWSATPSTSGHADVNLGYGLVSNSLDTEVRYVALQWFDTTSPTVSSVAITSATGIAASTLNAGDVVCVTATMSEATTVTGTPNLALNIGGTTVQAAYASGTGTTALVFNYTILAAQTDANGISIAANALSLNNGTLADAAGNAAALTHALVADNAGYLVDTTAPTVTHTSAAYTSATNTLVLTGTNFATLLETGETASTDIKARLDWSKLSWDINGDNATTANVSFALADISSAVVTDGTHLTVVLSTAKGTALEATAGFNNTGGNDTLDISAGFAKDVAGNAASTDAVANAALTIITPTVAGDAVIDLGASGKLIAPVQVEGKWYYFWDRSGDDPKTNTGSLNGGVDTTTHDVLDGLFNHDINGVTNATVTNIDGVKGTTDTYRYATLNGVKLALPTANGSVAYPQGIGVTQSGTVYTDAGASSNGTTSTYNDLLAIWDAYNSTGTGTASGAPPAWAFSFQDEYWSATPSPSWGHAGISFTGLVQDRSDTNTTFYVALQLVAPSVTSTPTDVSVFKDTLSNFDLSAVTFADEEGKPLTATLTASAGTFAASNSGSVTVSGTGTGTLTLAGTVANLNAWLDTVSNIKYTGASNVSGNNAATFTLKANDGTVDSSTASGNIDVVAPPAVTGVTSTTSNASYKAGDAISIQVAFSETVTVTGTPQLTLETGSTDRTINYNSGSGTSTLTFSYTVQAGDTSSDLNYTNTTALALNGSTINATTGGLAATLTLASPGAANSLGASKAIVIDTTAPTLAITSNVGAVKTGETATVTFTFSEDPGNTFTWNGSTGDVAVSGGTLGAISGSGLTRTATFTPTASLASGSASITVASGNYTDAAGNTGGAGTTPSISIDTTAPTLASSITISDTALKIGDMATVTFTFSEAVTGFTTADLTAPSGVLSNLASSDGGTTWTATLTPSASTTDASNVITLDYTGIVDAAGNAGPGSATSGNYAVDTTAPTAATPVRADMTSPAGTSFTFDVTYADTSSSGIDTSTFGTSNVTVKDPSNNALSVTGYAASGNTVTYTVTSPGGSWDLTDAGTYTIGIANTVKDLAGNAVLANATAKTFGVTVNTAPTITSGTTGSVAENASTSTVVYTATATDIDAGTTLTYSLGGTDAGAFNIGSSTGVVTLKASANFEAKSSYSFNVIATDDGTGNLSDTEAVTLTITNRDESAPTITSTATATAISENSGASQVIYTAISTDTTDYMGGSTTYSLKSGSDAGLTIDASSGAVTLTVNPNFEAKSSYDFTVVATDAASNATEKAVTLAINNLDEVAPTITSGATATAINENSGASQVVYKVTSTDTGDAASAGVSYSLKVGSDAALFSVNASTGAVTLTANPNFEAKSSYAFTVKASDGVNAATEQAVSLAINNLDEVAPTITSGATATAINENSGAAQVVYTAISTDTGDIATGSTVYSLKAATGDVSAFSINATTGAVTLTGNPDFETKPSYSFTVVATDAASNASEKLVALAITNLDEVAPTITSGATATAINENSGAAQVVYTVTSTDTADISAGVSYSLGGTDAGLFSISSSTGAVTLSANPNFEAKSSYSFTVLASDGVNTATEKAVSLAINNVNEGHTGNVSISGSVIEGQTLSASDTLADPDGLGNISYQWKAGGVTVGGGSSYTLSKSDVGKTINVLASYVDGGGYSENEVSAATDSVAALVDGTTVAIHSTTEGAQTTTTQTVAPVTVVRNEDSSTANTTLADIPLATDSSGAAVVQASLPVGVGLTSSATVTASGSTAPTLREQLIAASDPRVGDATQMSQIIANGIDQYVPTVTDSSQVTVRTITLTVAAGNTTAPTEAIHISGSLGTGESDTSHPLRQEALVIDASHLPSGTVLDLDNVEFAIIIGPVTACGGAGRNYVIGDGSAQTIILGADDDILHGGAGNDVVGSTI